ncbi:unnamed protein product [Hermetia illucens]|uniref:Galectin n=1 Tax=Hermetia illucens TaxID=343691 RepID=A0A7R8UZ60_HERIL|nr:galectin-4-like [Hermetia illucens]CAD7088614.1 unnamed protein product [Hermetia illucens]
MASLPAYNPPAPFLGHIPGGLYVGARLLIRGLMPHVADRFNIDLQCGPRHMQDNAALHLSIRPLEFTVVRNHFHNYTWGAEERIGGCPIRPGQYYEVDIRVEPGRYSIYIDGNHFCEFLHRIPFERVTHIHVGAGTTIQYVGKEAFTYVPPTVIIKPQPTPVAPIVGAVVGGIIGGIAASHRPGHHSPPRPHHRPPHHGPPHHGPPHHGPPHRGPPGAHFK